MKGHKILWGFTLILYIYIAFCFVRTLAIVSKGLTGLSIIILCSTTSIIYTILKFYSNGASSEHHGTGQLRHCWDTGFYHSTTRTCTVFDQSTFIYIRTSLISSKFCHNLYICAWSYQPIEDCFQGTVGLAVYNIILLICYDVVHIIILL